MPRSSLWECVQGIILTRLIEIGWICLKVGGFSSSWQWVQRPQTLEPGRSHHHGLQPGTVSQSNPSPLNLLLLWYFIKSMRRVTKAVLLYMANMGLDCGLSLNLNPSLKSWFCRLSQLQNHCHLLSLVATKCLSIVSYIHHKAGKNMNGVNI